MRHFKLIMAACLTLFLSSVSLAEFKDYNWQDPELEARFEELTFELRCPKCQNQNVADSDAPIAEDIRDKVVELLLAGNTNKEIVDHMIDRYTEFVTYKTRINWRTIWLYVAPAALLVLGVLALIFRTRRATSQTELTAEQQAKIDELLKSGK